MEVYIKNKLLSLGGSSEVLDSSMQPIFKVKCKIFSPTKKKLICSTDDKLLYIVRNRFFNCFFNKSYVYDNSGKKIATVRKNKWSFSRNYQILDTDEPMEISGKFFSLTSKILRSGEEVGVIRRDFTLIRDSFRLEADERDIPFMTALVIALDNIKDKRQGDSQ